MTLFRFARRLLAAAILLLLATAAAAHLLPAQKATMNIVGNNAYFVVSVPLSALSGVDDDGNGTASPVEIGRHSRDIVQQFNRRFHVAADGHAGTTLMSMAWPPQTDGSAAESNYIVVLHSVHFAAPPVQPSVATDLFGTRDGEGQLTMTAKHNLRPDSAEVAVLRPGASEHVFFRSGFSVFVDFVRLGVEHILTGYDHLLFLLTIIVAAAGWRYWAGVVTSFTIAHSITLNLAAFGLVHLAPTVVEPAIAASILLMALLNLWRGQAGAPVNAQIRMGIVFACGLLHGMGFATAINAMAAEGQHWLATLAGFNIGIELGQIAFVGLLLALAWLARRLIGLGEGLSLPRYASLTAAALGAVLLVARVIAVLPSVA